MGKLFNAVWFGGRDLLMAEDKGGNAGGASNTDDADDLDDKDVDVDSNEDGDDEDGDEGDGDGKGDDLDDLDQPKFSKRDVSRIVAGRISDVKKQFPNHAKYEEAVRWMGAILGTDDVDTIHNNLKVLYTNHMAKAQGMTPQGFQAHQSQIQQTNTNLKETKRRGIESEFDNSFVTNKEFSDASLFRDQIIDLAENGFTLTQAYWAVMGEMKSNKKADAAARTAEQLAQHKAQKKKGKQVTPGSTGGQGSGKAKIPPEIIRAAEKIGMDPEEYVAWSGITTYDDARKIRGKK